KGLRAVIRHDREPHARATCPFPQLVRVLPPDAFACGLYRLASLQLRRKKGGLKIGEDVARAEIDPGVLVDEASEEPLSVRSLVAQDLRAVDEARVVQQERTALTARDVLGFVEALCRKDTEGAERPPAIRAEQAVRVVLHDVRPARFREFEDPIELARDAGVMHRDNHSGPVADD